MMLNKCPKPSELDDLAMGRPASRRIQRHVEHCTMCRQVLEKLRLDAALVDRLREAARQAADPSTQRVIESCIAAGPPHTPIGDRG
ncbi:MAG: hypothetical protein U1D55_19505 [Phycisphaerae bacterium]